ncbi:hypothetical protein MNBD_GAMMA18-1583 [hydrothermal vent metagenome]|uniref:Uncharacterized protein n=1 Tax=hydrothermal vent metagenome TaxID=652676 RepID=A0A3B1ACC1_9ZZZZ
MKNIIIYCVVGLINIALNFTVFISSYNTLATPFLHEEQRMENANYIMTYTLFGFVAIGIFTLVFLHLFLKKISITKSSNKH